ncbi:GMC oxidoreductase [Streptomyces sp. NPDC058424]|uniref:GMC oxidoreductase n=1 Tax=Streptomyces sp. NPDC058424 TaxID=3346491 RepID=UPI0036531D8D
MVEHLPGRPTARVAGPPATPGGRSGRKGFAGRDLAASADHACGTARIGRENDPFAVVDSRFRVWGTRGLRVVDASVFPRIPGFFIVTAVYMIAEKASAAILEDASRDRRRLRLPGTARP